MTGIWYLQKILSGDHTHEHRKECSVLYGSRLLPGGCKLVDKAWKESHKLPAGRCPRRVLMAIQQYRAELLSKNHGKERNHQ